MEFDALLYKLPVGPVSMGQIREILHSIGAGERWGRKLVNRHIDAGDIIRIDNGAYQKMYSPSESGSSSAGEGREKEEML